MVDTEQHTLTINQRAAGVLFLSERSQGHPHPHSTPVQLKNKNGSVQNSGGRRPVSMVSVKENSWSDAFFANAPISEGMLPDKLVS